MTKLTVILPVYNAMPYLPIAVESILTQTLADFKLLIIDDGSTDSSPSYLDSIRDPRVTLFRQNNRGPGATLNRGLTLADTQFIVRMDADDVADPERLAIQLSCMESNPDIVMLGTQVDFLVDSRRIRGPRVPLDHKGIVGLFLSGRAGVCHASLMLRTEAVKAVNGYRIGGAGEDVDFCLRMCDQGRVANVDKVLYMVRIHPASQTVSLQMAIRRGRAYALECCARRRNQKEEPAFDEFARQWDRRGWLRKIRDRIDDIGILEYRRALIAYGKGHKFAATAKLAFAALCRPNVTVARLIGFIRRLWRKIKH